MYKYFLIVNYPLSIVNCLDNSQNIRLTHDKIFFTVQFDFRTCILAVQYSISVLYNPFLHPLFRYLRRQLHLLKVFLLLNRELMIPAKCLFFCCSRLNSTLSANGLMFIVVYFLVVNNITLILCFLIAHKRLCEYCAKTVVRKKTDNFAF